MSDPFLVDRCPTGPAWPRARRGSATRGWPTDKIVLVAAGLALTGLAGCQKPPLPAPPPPPYNTTIGLHDLMEHVIDPSTDVVWAASGVMVDFQGEHDLSPKTPEAWAKVHDAAAVVAESGNLLLLPGRLRDGKTWLRQAGKLSTLGLEAMKAADTKDK